MRGAVTAVLTHMEQAGASRVTAVDLVIGVSGHLSEDAARQYFTLFTAGTPAEKASLSVSWLPATYQCFACLHRFAVYKPDASPSCPLCGGVTLEVEHQDACYVHSIDVAFDDETDTASGEAALLISS